MFGLMSSPGTKSSSAWATLLWGYSHLGCLSCPISGPAPHQQHVWEQPLWWRLACPKSPPVPRWLFVHEHPGLRLVGAAKTGLPLYWWFAHMCPLPWLVNIPPPQYWWRRWHVQGQSWFALLHPMVPMWLVLLLAPPSECDNRRCGGLLSILLYRDVPLPSRWETLNPFFFVCSMCIINT